MVYKSTNQFLKGLNTSLSSVNQAKDTYSYALNAIKEDSINNPDLLSNEMGFSTQSSLGYNYILMGSTYLGKKDYILYIKNLESESPFNRIVLLEDSTSTILLDNIGLEFNQSYPIKSTYRINYKNQRIVYFVDGLNNDRVFNVDNGISITNLNQLNIDIQYVPAILQSRTINDTDGVLLTGSYEFFGSYKSVDNAVTPWFELSANPLYIIESDTTNITSSQYINIEGNDSGLISTKSVDLNIINLDTNFNKFRLGIVKTIAGTQTGYYIDDIPYIGNNKVYTYSGFAQEITVGTITDFLVAGTKYYGSNAITQSNNRLLRANNKEVKINIDYQQYANNIITDYYIEEEQVFIMPNGTTDTIRDLWWESAATEYSETKSLMRDEVYSVGVAFGLINEGIETEVYHIPGRQLNNIFNTTYRNQYNDSSTLPYSPAWDNQTITENGDTLPKWQLINTAASSTDGTVNKCAYWESTEVYPDGFGFPITGSTNNGINITNVRHHKIPSSGLEPIYRTVTTSNNITVFKRNIGLSFSNIEIPQLLINDISYIRIYITPRNSESNKSIVAKGIFTNCSLTEIYEGDQNTPTTVSYVVPLQPYNDLTDEYAFGTYNLTDSNGIDPKTLTTTNFYHSFYSPDTLLKNPVLNNDRVVIENEISGIVHYYDTMANSINVDPAFPTNTPSRNSSGYKRDLFYNLLETGSTGQLYPTGFDQTSAHDVYNAENTLVSTYKSIAIINNINQVSNSKSRRKLKKSSYVPFNGKLSTDQIGNMDNPYYSAYGPANVLVELDINNPNLGATQLEDTSLRFNDNDISTNHLENVRQYGDTVNGTYHFHPTITDTAVYRYGSLKVNNTSQYGQISGLDYKPTDLLLYNITLDSNNKVVNQCQGLIGDTWIDLFALKRVRYQAKLGYSYAGLPDVHVGISSFFTESTTNHRLRYASGITPQYLYPQVGLTLGIKNYLNWNRNDGFIVNDDNFYKYNTDYTIQSSLDNFGVSYSDIDNIGIIDYPTRIIYSNKLLDESSEDSYRLFLANNYLDIPKNTGFITHLFNRQQELYAITRDSLWRMYASNQQLQTSTDTISVGTGTFLSQDPIELMSIEGGYAGSSSKQALVETNYGYMYVDRNKGKFIIFGSPKKTYFDNDQKDIALLGANSFLEENYQLEILNQIPELDTDFDNPLCGYGYLTGFEPLNNRILITKLDFVLTPTALLSYKGIYDPLVTYNTGDIYIKNNIFYQVNSFTQSYYPIYESNDLSDFITVSIDTPIYSTVSSPANGINNITGSMLTYVPNHNFIGVDTFIIKLNCETKFIQLNINTTNINQSQTIDLNALFNGTNNGSWIVSGTDIVHDSNIGSVISKTINSLTLGNTYKVTYTATNYSSCNFNLIFGNVIGNINSSNGTYSQIIQLNSTKDIKFYSTGNVSISSYQIEELVSTPNGSVLDLTNSNLVENKSWTLSYNPILEQWISFHSYLPNNYLYSVSKLLTKSNSSQLKLSCSGEYGQFFDFNIKPFIIETIINEYKLESKVFDNITVNLTSTSSNDTSTNKFFDKLVLYTEYQCSGEIILDTNNLTKKERNWMINKFSDITNSSQNPLFISDWNSTNQSYPIDKVVNNNKLDYSKPWYQRGRFRDKFLSIRFIDKNLENNKLIINFVSSTFRKSQR